MPAYDAQILMGEDLRIGSDIVVRNNMLREILHYGEERYAAELSALIVRPYDVAVMLDDAGIDYRKITDYALFIMLAPTMLPKETIFLPDVCLGEMKPGANPDNGEPILYHPDTHIIIDRAVYQQIVDFVRATHFIPAEVEHNVGNEMAKRFLLRNMRRKLERKKKKPFEPQYPQLISSLVNTAGFKYSYDSVWDLRVSQFWDSFYRLNKMQSYNNTMLGVYTGNIDAKKIDMKGLSWFGAIDMKPKMDASKAVSTTA